MKTKRLLKTLSVVVLMMFLCMKGFAQESDFPDKLYLIGDATANNWDGDRSEYHALWHIGEGKYLGYSYLKAGELKFNKTHGWSYDDEYVASNEEDKTIIGEGSFGIVIRSDDERGSDKDKDTKFVVSTPGFYTLKIDLNEMQFSLMRSQEWNGTDYDGDYLDNLFDAAVTDKYIYAVGDATDSGWDVGNPAVKLTRDPANQFIYRTVTSLKQGEFKLLTSSHFEGFGFRYDYNRNKLFFTAGDWQDDTSTKIKIEEAGEYYIIVNLEENTLILEPLKLFVLGGNNLSKWSPDDAIELNKIENSTKFEGIIYLSAEDMRGESGDDPSFKMTIKKEAGWDIRYFFYRNETDDNKITKDPTDDRKWSVNETGEYLLEVDVKEETIRFTKLSEGNLSGRESLSVTSGSYCSGTDIATLANALGNNTVITSLYFDSDITSEATLTAINPNCLIYLPVGGSAPSNWNKNVIAGVTAITPLIIKDREIVDNQLIDYPFNCPEEIIAQYGVNYTRECYNDGNWETIILPFAVEEFAAFDDYIVEGFKYENLGDEQLIFTQLESITEWEANRAYIMRLKNNSVKAFSEFSAGAGTVVKTAPLANGFTGTYNTLTTDDITNCYVLNANGTQFGLAGNNNQLPTFRAYYIPTGVNNSRQFSVIHEHATNVTSSESMNAIYAAHGVIYIKIDRAQTVNVYSIDGVLVTLAELIEGWNTIEGLAKGIYIINNQKVVLN